VSFTAIGTCIIDAEQAGNSAWAPAVVQQSITINPGPNGMTVSPSGLSAGSTGNTLTFTYISAIGGLSGGEVTLAVPTGWADAPSAKPTSAGYVVSTCGTVKIAARTIEITGVTLAAGQSCTITYGSKSGGGKGAAAPGATATGPYTFSASEASTSSGTPTALATSPVVTVYAANGSGSMTVSPSSVYVGSGVGSPAVTFTFTYTAAAGGLNGGEVKLTVPTGDWPDAPSTLPTAAGYVTTTCGTVFSIVGRTVVVPGVMIGGGQTCTIVYGSTAGGGVGAAAPEDLGSYKFPASEASTVSGKPVALATSPVITITS
jgi:large repetitive protein